MTNFLATYSPGQSFGCSYTFHMTRGASPVHVERRVEQRRVDLDLGLASPSLLNDRERRSSGVGAERACAPALACDRQNAALRALSPLPKVLASAAMAW